jgi:tetratricopeptide (TPR) repeat protein
MSYINDALRKVQKEKESRYVAYEHIVSADGKKLEQPKRWLSIIGISIVFFWAVGIIVLLYWFEDTRIPAKIISVSPLTVKVPAQKTSAPPVAPAVINAVSTKPQVVKETTADKENKAALKKETASPELKVKQETAKSKALFAQALERQREGKFEEAKRLYRKVVKIDQHNVQAFNNLGVIYMSEKNYKRAIMRFNDAIKIKHNYPDAHYNLACLYAQKNDAARSLFYLKKAIEFNPEVIKWAKDDGDLKALVDLPEFKKLLEKQ